MTTLYSIESGAFKTLGTPCYSLLCKLLERQCGTIIVASEQGWIPALSLYILRVTLQNLMMNIELPPDLHLEVRKIRNIEM